MAILSQNKKGYLRGVRGVLITVLNSDGSMPASPTKYWIDTAQNVSVEAQVAEGETADLRGGDKFLTRVEDEDIVVGVDLTFTDARFDVEATVYIAGGSLITVTEGADERIIGWEAPTIAEQNSRTPFQAEVYVQSFDEKGGREAYLKYTFRYCKGYAPNIEHADQEWGTPEFTIKARENPATGESVYKKEFVSSLPPEAV